MGTADRQMVLYGFVLLKHGIFPGVSYTIKIKHLVDVVTFPLSHKPASALLVDFLW
jgi:hypothetical protein